MDNDYSFSIASIEIIVALAVAFIAGAILCSLLRLLGLCCRRPKAEARASVQVANIRTSEEPASNFQPDFPIPAPPVVERTPIMETAPTPAPATEPAVNRLSVEGGAYEADIDTLLRRGSTGTGSIPLPEHNSSSASFADRARESLGATIGTSIDSSATPMIRSDLEMPDDDHVDDLKKLEGIGPRIEGLLNRYGIKSYARLATMDRDRLRDILESGGTEFRMHEPKSWPYQAELAAKENWDRLREYQEFLLEGRGR